MNDKQRTRIDDYIGDAEAELKRALEWLENARFSCTYEDSFAAARIRVNCARGAIERTLDLLDAESRRGRP